MSRERPIPAPDGLDEQHVSLWRSAQRHLRRQGTWSDEDAPLLESYVRSLQAARRARTAADDAGGFTAGSKGQLVAHPGLKVAADAERDAARYAEQLILTPSSRKRHGVNTPDEGSVYEDRGLLVV